MKNIKLVIAAAIVSLFSSCQDAIDIIQPGELSPQATFQTVQDLDKGLLGAYGALSSVSEISFNSIFTDEVRLGFANGGQGLNDGTYGFILNTNSSDAYAIWQSNYTLINFANRVIQGADNVTVDPSKGEDLVKTKILVEARILRAYAHFKLLSYFSTDLKNDNALGVIPVNFVPKTNDFRARESNANCFELIEGDLAYADNFYNQIRKANNPDLNNYVNLNNTDYRFISPDFVTALRARMYLYRGKYQQASDYAQELIGKYPLALRGDYQNIWKDVQSGADEIIFKRKHINGEVKIGSIWASVDASVTGSPFFTMSTNLVNSLSSDDIRRKSFIGATSDFSDPGKIVINKYAGSANYALLNDEKIFRVSEMYFIKAEAAANSSDFATVKDLLQQITDIRYSTGAAPDLALPTSKAQAFGMILDQRRIELCYEGHRYLDLKRLGPVAHKVDAVGNDISNGVLGVDIDRAGDDCKVNGACHLSTTLASDAYKFTMPIPNDEFSANPAIRAQQNPGY